MSSINLTDAPSAVAASKCWLFRHSPIRFNKERMTHPSECGWCAYPGEVLISAVNAFLADHERLVAEFERLPAATQRQMVLRAQGYSTRPAREAVSAAP